MGQKFTEEDFKARLLANLGQDYELVGGFSGMKEPASILHKKCGRVYTKSTASAASLTGCGHCSPSRRKSDSEIMLELEERNPEKFVYSNLIRAKQPSGGMALKVTTKCRACGYEKEKYVTHLIREKGGGCAKCRGKEPLTTETFNLKVSEQKPDGHEYELAGEYVNDETKVLMRHKICGSEFYVRPNHFVISGTRCHECKSVSSGEKMVAHRLDEMNLKWKRQYTFEDCVDKSRLRFDFAVFDEESGGIAFLIEFDGDQHHKPIGMFGGKKALKSQQARDKIKNSYCSEKGIPLLRFTRRDVKKIGTRIAEAVVEHNRRKQRWTT